MITVKSSLGKSTVHGTGLFCDKKINQGEMVWIFNPILDSIMTEAEHLSIHSASLEQIKKYAYKSIFSGKWILCNDDSRFFNHADKSESNVYCFYDEKLNLEEPLVCFSKKDIEIGEELLHDYSEFESEHVKF